MQIKAPHLSVYPIIQDMDSNLALKEALHLLRISYIRHGYFRILQ